LFMWERLPAAIKLFERSLFVLEAAPTRSWYETFFTHQQAYKKRKEEKT